LKVGYFAQHQLDELSDSGTPYAHVALRMPDGTEARIRARCARMGFTGAKADTPITRLSGGEKARLMMGLAAFEGPHLLILDEPTNHLDIDSRLALMEAINDYEGAVILISHDRFLIESCADRLWLVNQGTVSNFDGDIDQYRQVLLNQQNPASPDKIKAVSAQQVPPQKTKIDVAALRKKVASAAAKMEKFQGLLEKIDIALSDPQAFIKETEKATQLSSQRRDVEAALQAAENEWLEASDALDTAL
jgi:ATP-binding cassette subfamily F protein 3